MVFVAPKAPLGALSNGAELAARDLHVTVTGAPRSRVESGKDLPLQVMFGGWGAGKLGV